ncbi:uncharacterized protein BHQ10_001235 [Talaromyces amestolkiae]|uniref:DUF7514 domain-containing protein n=1 Tax=Talaromyces amestolkiae TaxID=1196081 RepID=A0A364KNU3_TALAM|nr:uncharacterized protein BHQ10_001235 [Talaromyces amestolkiae]RAO65223.1 hypothetical protein BHQ10_001235 [Talaromyces amestolkiae]
MENPNSSGGDYWGTLINADKSPTPLLEELCIALAQLMIKHDAGNGSTDLTPDKLARFYREVGGNYDTLFLETKGSALSFIYQSLGCFHTLQPTTNPFEPPCIPALLPTGFVRWQVINLLLCPDEHVRYLQEAVSRWDVPNPCGGTFPKVIPREAFPQAPDKDMVEWHENVSKRLQQDHADQNSSRRSPPVDFVRYYSAATGARKYRHPFYERTHRFQDGSPAPNARDFSDHADETRHHRRRHSPDGRGYRARVFGDGADIRPGSRTSSRNPSPRQTASPASAARVPMRSKTTSARHRDFASERLSSYRKHRPMNSSDSSNNDDGLLPQRRHGSIDDRRHGRSTHLSPARPSRPPRRHSHDATSPMAGDSDVSPEKSRKSHRYDRHAAPRTQFHEDMFDDTPRPGRKADQPLPYEINPNIPNIPRVHVRYDGSPTEPRASKRGSGSSGSERARSSSNGSGGGGGGGGEASWKRNISPHRNGRKLSHS